MWNASRRAQDRLNDYWNALARHAPADELARLRAQIDPELTATIDSAIALHRRRRPDPVFGDRLEGELMNAFAGSGMGTALIPLVRPRPTNGTFGLETPAPWIPSLGGRPAHRRFGLAQLGLVALLLLTLIGGYFVYANRSEYPAVVQQGTPVPTPTEDWTNTRGDAGRTGLGASGPVGQPVTIWRFQADGPCDTAPAAVGDTVFAACGNGILYAIDHATGEERWQYSAQSPVVGGPTVLDGIVVLVDADGRLYGVDAETGEQIWLAEGTFYGAPVAKDGIITVGGFDGQLAAIDLATGAERWRYMVEEGGEAKNPAIGDSIVYSGSIANGFTAVDLQTGELVWQAETDGIETGTAVVANGVAYIGSAPGAPQGFLKAFDAATGELLWTGNAPIFTPAVQGNRGYAGSGGGEVTAIDLETGEQLWQVMVGGVARPATVAGDVVYLNSDGDETIYAFDTATGDQLWSYPVDGYLGDAGALKDGVLYVNTGGGSIYAIGGEHAIPAAGTTAGSPEPAASAEATVAASAVAAVPELLPAEVLWTTSGGDGGFDLPGRIAVHPNGQVWVADNRNHRFQIFDADGNFLETWGEQGKGDGQFQMMLQNQAIFTDIEFADDGSFVVLDPGNGRVQRFGPDRQFLSSFGGFGNEDGQFVNPIDLAIGPDGDFWVTDVQRHDTQQFDADGTYLASFALPDGYEFAWDHLIDEHGSHYLTVGGDPGFVVLELDSDGALVRVIGAPSADVPVFSSEFTELAFDAEGRLFVGPGFPDDTSIYVFDTDGTLLGRIEAGGTVHGLAIDASGDLYVLNSSNATLSKLQLLPPLGTDQVGSTAQMLWNVTGGDGGFDRPGRVAVAPDGAIWVIESNNHRFQIFDAEGTFIETWGTQGKDDGEFQFLTRDRMPFGDIVFTPDGSFFVLDPGNGRVQAFGPDRRFRFSFGSFGAGDGQFTVPLDLALAPDGTLWVTDDKRQDAQQFDQNGNFLSSFVSTADEASGSGYWFAWDHHIDVEGRHYFTVAGPSLTSTGAPYFNVIQTSLDGTFQRAFGPQPNGDGGFIDEMTEMAVNADGNLYVGSGGDGSSVFVFSPDGTLVEEIPTDAQVQGVAFDPEGNLIVSAEGTGTLSSYRLNGAEATPVAETGPTLLWTTEGGEDGFIMPGSITGAPDGRLWVADNGHHRFQILAPDGAVLERWGEQGKGDGQFQFRAGPESDGYGTVVFAPDGSFFVLDPGNFRIQHFAADRSFIAAWGAFGDGEGAFQGPIDLAVGSDGTLWVIDLIRRDVQHFDTTGTLLGSFDVVDAAGTASMSNGLTIGSDGLLYVTTYSNGMANGTILVFDTDGTLVKTIGEGVFARQAVRIAFGVDGRIYATEFDDRGPNGRMHIFDANGTLLRTIDLDGYPYGIALSADGSVAVSQYVDGTVSMFSVPAE